MLRPNRYFFIWVLAWCPALFALDPLQALGQLHHTSWDARNGINGIVTSLAQTTDGYLWVGTTDGLVRFDGISFEHYKPESGSLLATFVTALMAAPDGGLWIGYENSGASFLHKGRVKNYTNADGFPLSRVRGFARDHTGRIWAAVIGGFARLEGSQWNRRYAEWNFPDSSAWAVLVDREGTLWVSAKNQIVFLRKGAERFETTGIRTGQVSGLTQSPDGALVFYDHSLRRLRVFRDRGASQTEILPPATTPVNRAMFDRDGALWLGGDHLYRVPMPDLSLNGRTHNPTEGLSVSQGLSGQSVNAMLEDREGNVWVGTDGGLDRFRVRNVTWFPLPGSDFTLVAGSDGDVWASSRTHALPPIRTHDHKRAVNGPTNVYTAYHDPDGSVWFGADDGLVHWQNGKFVKIPVPKQVMELSLKATPPDPIMVSAITKDRSGNLWVAFGGSGEFRLTNGVWTFVPILADHPDWTPNYSFTDSKDRVWLCWGDRIAHYDHGKILVFGSNEGLDIGPPNVMAESGGRIWVGGHFGVAFFDGSRFRRLQAAGTPGIGSIYGMVGIEGKGLWLGTSNAIVYIAAGEIEKVTANPEYLVELEIFDVVSDLPEVIQTEGTYASAAIQASDGRIWLATLSGAVRVDPSRIYRNPLPPPVSIRSMVADDKVYSPSSGPQLPALPRNIRIDYAALGLSIPERVRYRYKLEPLDSDWQEAGSRREAFFTRLDPGQYSFRVIACNNDGVWNTVGTTIAFSVAPAWFQTSWFLAGCIAVALLLMYVLYQFRLQQLKRQFNLALEARVDERTRIARELHDTLLQSFHGLMLHFQVIAELLPDGKAKEQLEQTLERADEAIAEGRSAVYDLRSSTVTPDDLAQALRALGDELAIEDGGAFHLIIEGSARDMQPIVRDEVYRIAREALRNAFSHARAQRIEAEIAYTPRLFRLRIRDDGEGIAPAICEEGRAGHFGLSGMRERAKKVGGMLSIWSRAGAGTEVELSIAGSLAYRPTRNRSLFRWFRKKREET